MPGSFSRVIIAMLGHGGGTGIHRAENQIVRIRHSFHLG